eukprot:384996-Pyramimonas_sp.AAC.1
MHVMNIDCLSLQQANCQPPPHPEEEASHLKKVFQALARLVGVMPGVAFPCSPIRVNRHAINAIACRSETIKQQTKVQRTALRECFCRWLAQCRSDARFFCGDFKGCL